MMENLAEEVEKMDRHLEIPSLVIDNEPIGIVKMANETGYPHHKVRYSLRILENGEPIEPSDQGATATEQTDAFVANLDGKIDDLSVQLQGMQLCDQLPDDR
jgi:predicted transcriptional regulator